MVVDKDVVNPIQFILSQYVNLYAGTLSDLFMIRMYDQHVIISIFFYLQTSTRNISCGFM